MRQEAHGLGDIVRGALLARRQPRPQLRGHAEYHLEAPVQTGPGGERSVREDDRQLRHRRCGRERVVVSHRVMPDESAV
jgi:hypothetical protein